MMPSKPNPELCEEAAAQRAQVGALTELLTLQGPAGDAKLDTARARRLHEASAEIFRLRQLISRLTP